MATTKWSAQILLSSNRLTKVEFVTESNLRESRDKKGNRFIFRKIIHRYIASSLHERALGVNINRDK